MIIGIATLFSILFFGSSQYFFAENLEKGVKKQVVEKVRKKDILADLKTVKATIKDFNKSRKKSLKRYHNLNADYDTTLDMYKKFLASLNKDRIDFQDRLVNQRVEAVSKITDDEWSKIMVVSGNTTAKRIKKEGKKKQKDAFEKVKKTIEKEILDESNKFKALEALAAVETDFNRFNEEFSSINALESELIANRNATSEDAKKLSGQLNSLRQNLHQAIMEFHFTTKDLAAEAQWTNIMKSMNKVLN